MTGYEFHPEARLDLDEIWEFIRLKDIAARAAIAPFRHQGHRRRHLTSRPLRFIRVRDYIIAYAPDEDPLWVVAVLHGHRSPRTMAAVLRGRQS